LDVRIEFMFVMNIKFAVCWNVMACSLVDSYCLMGVRASYTTLFNMPGDCNISHEVQEEDCLSWSVDWMVFALL